MITSDQGAWLRPGAGNFPRNFRREDPMRSYGAVFSEPLGSPKQYCMPSKVLM
jgi:hypothetical protein